MDVYDDRFYGFTRRLMISIGLWPYQNPRYRKLLRILVFLVHVSGILSQYMSFFTYQYSMKLLIEIISFNMLLYIYILKYNAVYLNSTGVKLLLEQINCDCNALTDTREIEIIQKYASRGRQYTIYSGR
ncbi:uncharacterized protein LOC109504414 [Harpegnathos saltator]|uniref:uncharacterized protein LOC109504414 n=1 Tax=Harpegnathos saltator TaxID=610380 RepID=UPI0009488C99|nr:uncharacterized protein LOC109504414 [Harpegnathos saltator]